MTHQVNQGEISLDFLADEGDAFKKAFSLLGKQHKGFANNSKQQQATKHMTVY